MESAPDPATSPPPPPPRPDAGSVKKPAWNIPASLNGPIETGPPVIDESSWPALSEAAKSPMKVADGSAVGTTNVSSSSSSSPSKPHFPNPNPNPNSPTANPNSPSRSSKPSAKRSILLPSNPAPTPNPNFDSSPISPSETIPDQNAPARQPNHRPRGGGYNGNNNNNNNNRPRPNNNNNNNGNNNNSNRGGHSNNSRGQYRNLNGPAVGGYVVPPVYVRPQQAPPVLAGNVPAAPFIAAPPAVPVRPPPPFGAPPMVYPDMPPSPVYYVPAPGPVPPFVPAGTPVFLPPIDPQRAALLKQIDYYFSSDNLCKDTWLRGQMDEQGYVPISLIANFNKVKQITVNIPFILDTLHMSYVVEVQGDKIRRRGDWMNWLIRPSNSDNLTTRLQNVNLEGEKNETDKSASEITLDSSSIQEGGEKKVDDQN